ncbi:hypothetical protein Nepgr_024188 [Nepenthes gracilis]|uniref:Sister chromatid cohesion protein DCC1 n=1 Tax=Nepenthes gracilis TaxID=150966 RepID=A0AAD3T3V8_NEPGR|nr:hypothetical protein Nepgr_024188 [Nepenthes gracilis]
MEWQDALCRGAEAVLNILPNSSISVAYHPDFGPHNELLLLELDEKLLPDVLCQRATLRGQPDEDAVFCTSTKTYAVKFVGTSNSVFLIPPSSLSVLDEDPQYDTDKYKDRHAVASVIKIAPGNMELIEVAPMLDRLKLLLSENPLGLSDLSEIMLSADRERGGSVGLYTWDDLVEQIQASDTELKLGLEALSAVEINGYWRLVDEKCMDSVLNMLLNNAVLCEWSFNALSENEVVSMLESDGFPSQIVIHCLHVYGSKVNESLENESVWKLDERCVCAHFAKEILRGGKMKMETFLEEWMRKVPSRMRASLDMLEGKILTEKLGIETWVRAFSASSLPYNPRERFSILFRERSKWEWKDLQPYIRDLRVPGLSSEGLLLKYTRRTQPTLDADPIFSAR